MAMAGSHSHMYTTEEVVGMMDDIDELIWCESVTCIGPLLAEGSNFSLFTDCRQNQSRQVPCHLAVPPLCRQHRSGV